MQPYRTHTQPPNALTKQRGNENKKKKNERKRNG